MLRIFRYASTTRSRISWPDADFFAEVDHRHPQPEDLRAALRDDLLRLDGVAERLRHLAPLVVDHHAVRQDGAVRRRARACRGRRAASSGTSRDTGRCPRDTGRPATAGRRGDRAPPRGSIPSRTRRRGCRARARRTSPPQAGHARSGGQEILDGPFVPRVRAVPLEDRCHARRRAPTVRTASPQRRARRRPGSARPTRAGAKCTSRAGAATMLRSRSSPQAGTHCTGRDGFERLLPEAGRCPSQ